ncbi:MAG: FAD-dependent oxidoreductase [Parvularculaceae bacterium]
MAFDEQMRAPRGRSGRVAVIGAGAAGLAAAWLLSRSRETVIYEADGRLGGHANTVDVPLPGGRTVPVDAGFIVYNEPAYPNLTALFDHLGVATQATCMSFAASMRGGEVEYSGQSLSSVFADRRKALSPSFLRMLIDVAKFYKDARRALASGVGPGRSLAAFVAENGYSEAFVRDFLKPMASAIWSTPCANVLDFSADAFLRFYENHGLLQVLNLPQWRTVCGGSRAYVRQVSAPFERAARLDSPVAMVSRTSGGVVVRDRRGAVDRFDDVVIATHADAALSILDDPTNAERRILSAFRYQPNEAFVHLDERQMPRRPRAWASWNFVGDDDRASVTYWMNRLQDLDCEENVFVTLNPLRPIAPDRIVAAFGYTHPMFDLGAWRAQQEIWSLQGVGGVWFCGAHFGQGFHEDAVQAGLAVAEAIGGVRRPWTVQNESGRICLPAKAAAAMAAE